MSQRQWKRTVALLGNRALEETIQEELVLRFPPSQFLFDIEVVESTIRISNDAKIQDVIHVEFPRSRPSKAAILTAASELIAVLKQAERP